ncbi:MAG: hypothetical protein JO164_03390, partial [Candidatus Eremiobacteraeota bacterium]|nr:hypothetical protein [Candidatus Eremiobacteraeota bacterium]
MIRAGFLASLAAAAASPVVPSAVPSWRRGALEIHHLSFGRGNATLCIFPDGTTLLIDAGAVRGNPALLAPIRSNASRRPGEWIGRYIKRRLDGI